MSSEQPGEAQDRLFGRVLCGVDGSPAGVEAVRQAVRLAAPGGSVLLVSVATPAAAVHPEAALALEVQAGAALREAERAAGRACASRALVGDPVASLLAAAAEERAMLVAVGSHGVSRLGGILAGSVATALLHRAPCSVLIARPAGDASAFPARIAVGLDGSEPSRTALALARALGSRFEARVLAVAARGAAIDFELPDEADVVLHVDERDPVTALLDAAGECDLLVLGARGLYGVRALGSVSERVAHRAPSSVFVIRGATTATEAAAP